MQNNNIKILGLGRCVIGHMANYTNVNSKNVDITHHYLLNYETLLQDNLENMKELSQDTVSKPNLKDQWFALDELETYDICLIEIFPPSIPYNNSKCNKIACFESYSQEVKQKNFESLKNYKFQDYINVLKSLIAKIKHINNNIKIIFVNGELTLKDSNNFIGSKELNIIINKLRDSTILDSKDIKFLDMNNLIPSYVNDKVINYEVGFPYLYLRKIRNSNEKVMARDCKHAIKELRHIFLKELYTLIGEFGFCANIFFENETVNIKHLSNCDTFQARANNFISNSLNTKCKFVDLTNARDFSIAVSYVLETNDNFMIAYIEDFIKSFNDNYLFELSDLKYKFYYIRTIAVFIYQTKICLIDELCEICIKIVSFNEKSSIEIDNITLLWFDNIFTIIFELLSSYPDKYNFVVEVINLVKNSRYAKEYIDLDKFIIQYENF